MNVDPRPLTDDEMAAKYGRGTFRDRFRGCAETVRQRWHHRGFYLAWGWNTAWALRLNYRHTHRRHELWASIGPLSVAAGVWR